MTNWLKFSTGIKVCEIVKDLGIVFVSSRKAPPEDVHISILLLNANAHGRLYLRSSSSTYEDNSTCMKDITKIMTCIMKNGRLQNDFGWNLSSHMRNLSSHHIVSKKVADDHQV